MKVCVLQPDYSTTDVDYKNYDPSRDLSSLLPSSQVHHVLLNKLHTYKQLRQLKNKGYDIFVNLCEGYLDWSIPSIDVIHSLELLNLPYTGPTATLYDPPKELMKYIAYTEGVKTPAYFIAKQAGDVAGAASLQFPLFVKPAHAGDSLGIDEHSLVNNVEELCKKTEELFQDYDEVLVEEYIAGREFTVLVAAHPHNQKECKVYQPVEYIFPEGVYFKTYALKTSELHPEANISCNDETLSDRLRDLACKIFVSFSGVGYARLDFRMNEKGELFFLEINFTCSVFYTRGMEGSADYILQYDADGQPGFLKHIIAEGIERFKRKQKKYVLRGNAIDGYGIYANRRIAKGEVIFKGEEMNHRIVTRNYVQQHWNEKDMEIFRRYAYPISNEVYILWDANAGEWAPQNHSCQPNTAYKGLNVTAITTIDAGEEFTLDYGEFLNEEMQPFACNCGAPNCRKFIQGRKGNNISEREHRRHGDNY